MISDSGQGITPNVRVYNQLRLRSANVSSYDDLGRWVTDDSVLYVDSDSQTTNQAIGDTRCYELWAVEQTSDPLFYDPTKKPVHYSQWPLQNRLLIRLLVFEIPVFGFKIQRQSLWLPHYQLTCIIVHNVRVYDQLRLQSADVSSYDDLGRWVTDVSVLYFDSDSQTTSQAIGYTRCCELWAVEQTSDPLF